MGKWNKKKYYMKRMWENMTPEQRAERHKKMEEGIRRAYALKRLGKLRDRAGGAAEPSPSEDTSSAKVTSFKAYYGEGKRTTITITVE